MNKLTIAIPTYNRCSSVCKLVSGIINEGLLEMVNIIVIDDGSSDQTYQSLQKFMGITNLKLLGNEKNKGLAYTFLGLFEGCETDYLMIVADDDMIFGEGVRNLMPFLERVSPDFVSTAWLGVDGKTMRTKNREEPIGWADLRSASNHAPGLVYRVGATPLAIEIMKSRLSRGCYATSMYPQVVMVILLSFSSYSSSWWSPVITGGYRPSGPRQSQLVDSNGDSYFSVSGIWQEQLAFCDLYDYIISISKNLQVKNIAEQLKVKECLGFYNKLADQIARENEVSFFYFRLGASFRIIRRPFRSIGYTFKYVVLRIYAYWVLHQK